jgi:8-hydroxy-5-deazaflavin:NADPH oxidoreductase
VPNRSRALPEARVVKAFNATFAEIYAAQSPRIDDKPLTIFYAGDDSDAKRKVAELISGFGFEPIDAGPLVNARYLEPLSLLNIHLGRVLGYGTRIGFSFAREAERS